MVWSWRLTNNNRPGGGKEGREMDNKTMLQVLQDRIDEIVSTDATQRIMAAKKRAGRSDEEIRDWVVGVAICTLNGQ
jgi:hypothetical protein